MGAIVQERVPILVIQQAAAVELQVGQEHCALADDKKRTADGEEQRLAGGKPCRIVVGSKYF